MRSCYLLTPGSILTAMDNAYSSAHVRSPSINKEQRQSVEITDDFSSVEKECKFSCLNFATETKVIKLAVVIVDS